MANRPEISEICLLLVGIADWQSTVSRSSFLRHVGQMLAHLIGIKIFDVLSKNARHAVGHLEEFHFSFVLRSSSLTGAGPEGHGLSHTGKEVVFRAAGALQAIGGDGFKTPGRYLPAGFFDVDVHVRVRILPIDARQGALHIEAFRRVELHSESVMRKGRAHQNKRCQDRHQKGGALGSHGYDFSLENTFGPQS